MQLPIRHTIGHHDAIVASLSDSESGIGDGASEREVLNANGVVGYADAAALQRVTAGVIGIHNPNVIGSRFKWIADAGFNHGSMAAHRPAALSKPTIATGPIGGLARRATVIIATAVGPAGAGIHSGWQDVPAHDQLRRTVGDS